ncbi:MAG: hydroxymethylglutaryl-CoA lyase, partial [Acidobacteria bacterium]
MTESENYVEIVEVSPRDGLQGLSRVVETEQKLNLIRALGEAGFKRIEVTSLVSPKYVPQMADAVQLLNQLGNQLNFSRMVLALNEKGYKRAIELGVEWICYVIAATESMSRRNANTSVAQSI